MKITKSQLKQIIKEELAVSLLAEAEGQKYCCFDGEPFKVVSRSKRGLMFASCGDTGCRILAQRFPETEFQAKLKSGEFKPI